MAKKAAKRKSVAKANSVASFCGFYHGPFESTLCVYSPATQQFQFDHWLWKNSKLKRDRRHSVWQAMDKVEGLRFMEERGLGKLAMYNVIREKVGNRVLRCYGSGIDEMANVTGVKAESIQLKAPPVKGYRFAIPLLHLLAARSVQTDAAFDYSFRTCFDVKNGFFNHRGSVPISVSLHSPVLAALLAVSHGCE